jgi:hypothetical protein
MSITVPSLFIAPGIIDVTTGETIDDTDYTDIIQSLHTLWQRQGARGWGKIFDPVQTTTSTTYVNDAAFWLFHPAMTMRRPAYNSGTRVYLMGLTIIGANIRVQDLDARATATVVGATMAQATGLYLAAATDIVDASEIQWRVDVAGTGRLAAVKYHEGVDVTSYLI